jgi:hypothetical protein
MIAENNYLVPDAVKENYATPNKFLLVITDLESEKGEDRNPVIEKLGEMKEVLDRRHDETKEILNSIVERQTNIIQT